VPARTARAFLANPFPVTLLHGGIPFLEFKVVSNPDSLGFTRGTATSGFNHARNTPGEQNLIHNAGKYLHMRAFNCVVTITVVWLVVEVVGLTPYIGVIASAATIASASLVPHEAFRV
jgi:hypothetical protein